MDPRFDVELIGVTKRYGGTLAVDAISLRIPKASYCCRRLVAIKGQVNGVWLAWRFCWRL